MCNIENKLEIVLITYNRRDCLERTFKHIFAEDSPIRDYNITILNNSSTDGSTELINEYCSNYSNIKHIINSKNIGGNANISKALVEIPKKEYIWVLCDNDDYDWSAWGEVENAVENGVDAIITRHCENKLSDIFYYSTLVSGCIYKTGLIDEAVTENIYDFIPYLFPHLAPIANVINNEKTVYIVSKDIVHAGINPGHDGSFIRGMNLSNLNENRKNIFWSVGYFNSLRLINDEKKRTEIIDGLRHFHKSLFDLFKTVMVKNKVLFKNYPSNLLQIFRMLNFRQKLKFIFAFLIINLSFKDYSFYEIRSKEQWKDYFSKISEQKYLDKLSRKLKGKRVLLYGAGIITETIIENYDLSKLNIIGIADKRFERTGETDFMGLKAIKPDDINKYDFDSILITLKLFNKIKKSLQNSGMDKKMYSVINKNNRYAVRT